jgi:hypothetical protein
VRGVPGASHANKSDGITAATSSFVDAAIVPLLKTKTWAAIKPPNAREDSTQQINEMIRARVKRESLVDA